MIYPNDSIVIVYYVIMLLLLTYLPTYDIPIKYVTFYYYNTVELYTMYYRLKYS